MPGLQLRRLKHPQRELALIVNHHLELLAVA
jgi:hypothetical protein